jgi:hypothetical protein
MGHYQDGCYHEHDIEQLKRDGEAAQKRMDRAIDGIFQGAARSAECRGQNIDRVRSLPNKLRGVAQTLSYTDIPIPPCLHRAAELLETQDFALDEIARLIREQPEYDTDTSSILFADIRKRLESTGRKATP